MPNKRIGQIIVYGGKSVKFNKSIVLNNSKRAGGPNCLKQIIVQCEKVTSIFVFFSTKAIFFTRRDVKVSLENYTDRCIFSFFLPNMHKLCAHSCHRRYSNCILYLRKTGEFLRF